ncbi:MAG: CPBP family intramembrane glutamic endopeptidase [Actinomycetota bacterium]
MKEYLNYTRSPWCSYLFALPLLFLYQAVVLAANLGQQRVVLNGADAMVQGFLSFLGVRGWLASWLVLAVVAGILTYRLDAAHRNTRVRKVYFWTMLGESAVYAAVFGTVVSVLTALVLPGMVGLQLGGGALNFGQKLATSLGAGLYEELVFRLFLTGGLLWFLSKLGWKPAVATGGAVLIASFLFSLVHYIGPYADNLQLTSFTFRFVAGVILAGLFAVRGFAVAAWTHALYDVFLLLGGKG